MAGQWHEVLIGDSPIAMVYRVKPTRAERVRLSLRGTSKPPGIEEFGLYVEPDSQVSFARRANVSGP